MTREKERDSSTSISIEETTDSAIEKSQSMNDSASRSSDFRSDCQVNEIKFTQESTDDRDVMREFPLRSFLLLWLKRRRRDKALDEIFSLDHFVLDFSKCMNDSHSRDRFSVTSVLLKLDKRMEWKGKEETSIVLHLRGSFLCFATKCWRRLYPENFHLSDVMFVQMPVTGIVTSNKRFLPIKRNICLSIDGNDSMKSNSMSSDRRPETAAHLDG